MTPIGQDAEVQAMQNARNKMRCPLKYQLYTAEVKRKLRGQLLVCENYDTS
jgi:hypothetical protein